MITLYISNCRQNEKNTIYPKKVEIGSVFDLKTAVSNDYVCARYKGSKRGNDNFVESDCLPFDIDNDHTEDEGKWIKSSDIAAKFPDVEFFVHYSRNNMKEKEGKKPRPKFHVFFKCAKCSDKDDYIRLKNLFYKFFPYVDDNALDAARFFYGTENPEVEYFSGELGIDDFLSIYSLNDMSYEIDENGEVIDSNDIASNKEVVREEIGEGSRNATMFKLARKFIWRHDDTDFAYSLFLEQAKYCNPPLSDAELSNIWKSNQAYLARMKANGKYIPPQEYFKKNAILKTLKPKDFTDLGQAEVMAKYFNGKIAYSNATGFLVYKDNYWQEDPVFSKRCAQIMTDKQLEEAKNQLFSAKQKLEQYAGATVDLTAAMKNGTDPQILKLASEVEEAKAYENYILKRRNSAKLQSSLEELKPLVQVYVKDLDKDAFLLSTPTKTYDLRKGIEGAMNPDAKNMITKSTTLSPSLKGKDKWLDFLNECFNDDQELIDYVQRICGLAAIGKVYIEGIIISYGDGGNGKSTFWNTIARVLGSYYGKISADALTTNCKKDVKLEQVKKIIKEEVLIPLLGNTLDGIEILVNPTGAFFRGGPYADSGLTGRKLMVDTYGGVAHHGGGAFSGKDYTKVDRSGAYYARYVAKSIVKAGLSDRCEVVVSYSIGVSNPISVSIDTFGTGKLSDDELTKLINDHFDFSVGNIIKELKLKDITYQRLAEYGHFGNDIYPWECVDGKVEELKKATAKAST